MIESRQSELFIPSIEAVRQLISNYIQARERSELPRSPAKTGFARYKDEDTGERATMTQYKPALLIIDHTLCIASLHTIEQTDGTITTELNLERHPFGEDGQEQGHPKYRLLPYQLYSLSLISHQNRPTEPAEVTAQITIEGSNPTPMTKVQFDQFSREVVSIAENGKETQVFGSDDVLQ